MSGRVILLRALCLLAAALLTPAPLRAVQTAGTASGSIVGTVTDATGGVLPGVTVSISGEALMGRRTTVTNSEGRYRFAALDPGAYSLTFGLSGFSPARRDGVRVGLAVTATVDVSMTIAVAFAPVQVSPPTEAFDRHASSLNHTFDAQDLVHLPHSRSMFALLSSTPAVEVSRVEVGGGSGSAGGNYAAYGTRAFNRPMVEGINVSGIFPTGFTLDYGSFEEVSLVTAGQGPEWPTPSVHPQFVTKSGGNRYRGTLYADHQDGRWQAFNVDGDQIARAARSGGGLTRDANRQLDSSDVNADIGGFIVRDRLWWYSSGRRQDIAARLVNFSAGPYRTHLRNYAGKATYAVTAGNRLVAFAHGGRNHQPNRLDPFAASGAALTPSTAINRSADSTADQRARGWVWKGEWNSIVRDALLFELRVGQFRADQRWRPNGASPRFEDLSTLLVRGGNRDWRSILRRTQMFGTLSYFRDGRGGSHHLKTGVEPAHWVETESWIEAYPGNVLHVLRNETPDAVVLFAAPSRSLSGLRSYTAYAVDSWRPTDRLTLNLGLRFDRFRAFLPEQEHPAGSPGAQRFAAVPNLIAWNVAAPRFGAVFDLTGDGTTLARATLGQFRLPPGVIVGFNANPNSDVWWTRYRWSDPNRSGVWEPGEEGALVDARGGVALERIDPQLELPVMLEVTGWLERELPSRINLRTGVVWRREHQHFMRQNANLPFDAFSEAVPLRDPGGDAVPGTADDGAALVVYDLRPDLRGLPPSNVVRNVPGSSSQYWSWEVATHRRIQGRWAATASFTHTWSRDHADRYAGQIVRANTYPITPNDLINAGTGGRHEFRTWTAKAYATYLAPRGVRISPILRHQSGQPFGRTILAPLSYATIRILAEPIGTRRTDNITIVDVRVGREWRLTGRRRLSGFVDVFNCLNANADQNVIWSSGASFLRPVTIVPPRIARIGARFSW